MGFGVAIAEDETPAVALVDAVFFDLLGDVTHAFVGRQASEQGGVFDGLVVNFQIVNTKIMEGGKHLLCQGVLQRDLECDDMVKEREDVVTIGTIGRGGHSQVKARREVRHD